MSGIELVRVIREKYPQIEVALMSADSLVRYEEDILEYKIQHYFTKPLDFEQVRDAIDAVRLNIVKLQQ